MYLARWNANDEYKNPEDALIKLFKSTYPLNDDLLHVLTKVYMLNHAYSAGVRLPDVVTLSKHILELNFDDDVGSGQLRIVDKIRQSPRVSSNYYSFATKYCSFHNPETFPMYDSRIVRMLTYFRRQSNKEGSRFSDFVQDDLHNYGTFFDVIYDFRKFYRLEAFSFREIDKYLWLKYEDVF